MDEMDDYYRNKISLCPKYIEWTTLPDKSVMFYCKKNYRKPVDEIKLLAHIKRTIVTNDRATQKRKKQKSESLTYDELLEKVRNNGVYSRSYFIDTFSPLESCEGRHTQTRTRTHT